MTRGKRQWIMPEPTKYEIVEGDVVVEGPFDTKKAAEIRKDVLDAEFEFVCKFRVRPVEKKEAVA